MLIAIVGGGPAGVSCAAFLKRYNVDVVIYEKRTIGGLIENAWFVENFPLVEPAPGEFLVEKFRNIVKENNIDIVYDEIFKITKRENYGNDGKIKLVGKNNVYFSDIVVIATGTKPKRIEKFEISNRIVYEFRDLPKDAKNIAFYGGGDVSFDGAIKNAMRGNSSTVFVRGNKIKAVPKLVKEVERLGIPVRINDEILNVESKNSIDDKIIVETSKGRYTFDALLIAIGRLENRPEIENVEIGKEVYIIGDVAHVDFRQSSIAIGDGVKCAMEILKKIEI
ncbi:NAD(P)/FAD-dependent oxidoreductase [Fervidobacterium nodosum]|uniref:FAD-dependent pyridine nucleotide-disulphide oxidoreductase n=1 Tax=Fervidobacterium nodosum (strain ATCC 35602 / DSM 5306 / Rt17-B1) TaxID=381764 RepID=A7HKB4_FERNB|nr:NAD(P)/FAD-dependent oxidoreductase [Fervidobacterium nodosum]ABS60347.1 FAD-dependent pyridine nucleotide-disulphide oxidoreductase [Fervidobacterium nodosum Rt17-B1]